MPVVRISSHIVPEEHYSITGKKKFSIFLYHLSGVDGAGKSIFFS
jgi:hypothetical protein